MSQLLIKPGSRILFQGDSITNSGRHHRDDSILGQGYPNFIAAWLSALYPAHNLVFLNRGISGNRIYDLEDRWSKDCIDLQPDYLSILIGVNDTWRIFDSNTPSPIADFEACYRRILDRVIKETKAKIILLEPFVLPTQPDRVTWWEDLILRIAVVRRVAVDYNAILIPLDGLFAAASTRREAKCWSADGVHPTQAGHALISQAWIDAVTL